MANTTYKNKGGSSGLVGITSINSDTTPAQKIIAGSGITVTSIGGTTTIQNTGSGTGATLTTKLSITAHKATGSTYSVAASGTGYNMSGDIGALGASAAYFNGAEKISIYLNGVYQIKGVDVVWASATTFVLNHDVDLDNEIICIS